MYTLGTSFISKQHSFNNRTDKSGQADCQFSLLISEVIYDIFNTHWAYYYNLSLSKNAPFIAEVIAHDQASLVEVTLFLQLDVHEQLLEAFLYPRWCENSSTVVGIEEPLGVLKAKIKLATRYLAGRS